MPIPNAVKVGCVSFNLSVFHLLSASLPLSPLEGEFVCVPTFALHHPTVKKHTQTFKTPSKSKQSRTRTYSLEGFQEICSDQLLFCER